MLLEKKPAAVKISSVGLEDNAEVRKDRPRVDPTQFWTLKKEKCILLTKLLRNYFIAAKHHGLAFTLKCLVEVFQMERWKFPDLLSKSRPLYFSSRRVHEVTQEYLFHFKFRAHLCLN